MRKKKMDLRWWALQFAFVGLLAIPFVIVWSSPAYSYSLNKFKDDVKEVGQGAIDVGRGKKGPLKGPVKATIKVIKDVTDAATTLAEKQVNTTKAIVGNALKLDPKGVFDATKSGVLDIGGEVIAINGRFIRGTVATASEDALNTVKPLSDAAKKVNDEYGDLGKDVLDEITGDGAWKIDLGVVRIKSSKSVGTKFDNLIDKSGDLVYDAAYAIPKIAMKMGITLELMGKYLSACSEGMPPLLNNPVSNVVDPDFHVFINSALANIAVRELIPRGPQPINHKKPETVIDQYYDLGSRWKVETHPGSNSLLVQASQITFAHRAKDIVGSWDINAALKIKGLTLQLYPRIESEPHKVNGKRELRYIAKLYGRVVYLDIKDTPPKIECMVAYAINDNFATDAKNRRPLYAMDISEYVDPQIHYHIKPYLHAKVRQHRFVRHPIDASAVKFTGEGVGLSISYREGM